MDILPQYGKRAALVRTGLGQELGPAPLLGRSDPAGAIAGIMQCAFTGGMKWSSAMDEISNKEPEAIMQRKNIKGVALMLRNCFDKPPVRRVNDLCNIGRFWATPAVRVVLAHWQHATGCQRRLCAVTTMLAQRRFEGFLSVVNLTGSITFCSVWCSVQRLHAHRATPAWSVPCGSTCASGLFEQGDFKSETQ